MKRLALCMMFVVIGLCLAVTDTYSEDLKEITVFGTVTYRGEELPGCPVKITYNWAERGHGYVRERGELIYEAETDQYGNYYIVCNVDRDHMQSLADNSLDGNCWLEVNALARGLWHGYNNVDYIPGLPIGDNSYPEIFGRDLDLRNDHAGPAICIMGQFLDENNKPIANARVYLFAYLNYDNKWHLSETIPKAVYTNSDGSFHLWGNNVRYGFNNSLGCIVYCYKLGEDGENITGAKFIQRTDDAINETGLLEKYHVHVKRF